MRNPHQDRNPFKSFTSGWNSGWRDLRPPAVPLPIDTMERGGTPAVPLPKVTGPMPGTIPKDIMGRGRMPAIPLPRVSGESFRGPLAYTNDLPWIGVGEVDKHGGTEAWKRYNSGDPRYYWDPKGAVKTVQPPQFTGAYPKLAMNKGLDNWGGNLKGTFDLPGYGDPSSLDPWGQDWDYRDDDYDVNVLDPGFNDYGPGPLYFG